MRNENVLSSSLIQGLGLTVFAQIGRSTRGWLAGLLVCAWSAIAAFGAPTVTVTSSTRNVLAPGQSVNLSVSATGTGTVTYQWLRKGKAIAGATSAALAVTNASYADSGWYLVDATDGNGTTRSKPMFVIVAPDRTQIIRWGTANLGIPTDVSDAIAVYADAENLYFLRREGTVAGYGSNRAGQTDIPSDLNDVVQVSSRLALKKDGTVVAWGNDAAQSGLPPDLNGVVSIASSGTAGSGVAASVALKSDGTVVAWGSNLFGQCDVPANLTGVIALAVGDFQTMALRNDGTVVAWGSPRWGGAPPPSGLSEVIDVAGGWMHSLALKSDGTVVSWGSNNTYGQKSVPTGLEHVVAICAGSAHSIALKNDSTVVAWGSNYYGQSTVPTTLSNSWMVAAVGDTSFVLRDASGDAAPLVTEQPFGQTASESQSVSLTATVTGTAPLSLQWRKNGTNINGANSAVLAFRYFTADDAGTYDLVATNYLGSVTTNTAVLSVVASPAITTVSPAHQVLRPSDPLNLSVTAAGTGLSTYQWFHNGRIIPGATGSGLSVDHSSPNDGGWYIALATDEVGTRRSSLMFVDVAPSVTELRIFGETTSGVVPTPSGLNDAMEVSLSASPARIFARKRDGTVVGWGDATTGMYGVPAGLTNIVRLAAGEGYVLALKSDGTVTGWGDPNSPLGNIPTGLKDVVAISAKNHALALKSNGTVVAWGIDTNGSTSVPEGLVDVVAISAGSGHSLALKRDGTVLAWGYNNYGQTIVPADLTDVTEIAAGNYHSIALKRNATVVSWGGFYVNPIPSGLSNIDAISAGFTHSLVLGGDGTVNIWGKDGTLNPMAPQPSLGGVVSIASGGNTAVAIVDPSRNTTPTITKQPLERVIVEGEPADFQVKLFGAAPFTYQWRRNGIPVPGATSSALHIAYVVPSDAGDYDVLITNSMGSVTTSPAILAVRQLPVISAMSSTRQVLVPGQQLQFSVTASGTGALGYQWMHNGRVIAGATNANYSVGAATLRDSGWYVVLITDDFGTRRSPPMFVTVAPEITRVRAWGGGGGFSYGGDQVPEGLSGVVKITAGPSHSLVLKRNGTVEAWGYNADGQSNVPSGLSDVVDLASHFGIGGYGYSLALKSNGTLVQWGGGSAVPDGLNEVVSIAAGNNHVLALKNDGTVVSWANGAGYSASALPPPGLRNVVAIAAGYNRSIALKSDGSVVTWGDPWSDETSIPAGLTNVIAVASGNRHSLALKSDGTVVAWGFNGGGQLDVPPSLDNVVAISASAFYSLALKSDGSVVEWGNSGQTTPPADLDNGMAVSAGYYFSLALQYAPIFTSSPADSVHFEKETTSFAVTLFGAGSSAYQWRKDGVNIAGATNSTLTLSNLRFAEAGDYTVVATNSVGSTTSTAGSLVVFVSPAAKAVVTGQSAAFAVVASGANDSTYQWRRRVSGSSTWNDLSNSGVFSGTTTATLLVNPATLAMSGDQFRCVVTGSAGATTSEAAVLTVAPVRPATFDGQGYLNRYPDLLAAYGALSDRQDQAWIHYYTAGIFAGRSDGDFDPAAYLAQYPELQVTLGNSLQAAALHWYNTGRQEGRRIPAGFDLNSYLTRYPDVAARFGTDLYGAWLHYHDVGIYDGEVYDDLFRVEEYLALYPDLFAIFGDDLGAALDHWLSTGRIEGKLGRIPLEFKPQGYFARNPDVATAVGNDPILAWGHYWLYGIYEGRAYDDELRVFEYLAINADLTAAFVNDWRQAALHWMRYGRTEGRLGRLPLTFNVSEYLVRSPDVAAVWGTNPTTVFLHYWAYGIDEGRNYDDLFRPVEYLALNPDLASALGTDRRLAFKHWVRYGQSEGRPGRNP